MNYIQLNKYSFWKDIFFQKKKKLNCFLCCCLCDIYCFKNSISALQWLCNADKKSHIPQRRLSRFFKTLYTSLVRGARLLHPLFYLFFFSKYGWELQDSVILRWDNFVFVKYKLKRKKILIVLHVPYSHKKISKKKLINSLNFILLRLRPHLYRIILYSVFYCLVFPKTDRLFTPGWGYTESNA